MTSQPTPAQCPGVPGQPAAMHKVWGCSQCNPIVRAITAPEPTHEGPSPYHGGTTTHREGKD